MAATSVITCPECHKKFKGREELLGKRVRCPNCNHGFIVQKLAEDKVDSAARSTREAVTAKAAAPQPGSLPDDIIPLAPLDPPGPGSPASPGSPGSPGSQEEPRLAKSALDEELEQDENPYGVHTLDLAPRCPNCANEMESATALICLHCGYNTQTRRTPGQKKTVETTSHERWMWRLPGLACAFAIFVLFLLHLFNCFAVPGIVNSDPANSNWTALFDSEALRLWIGIFCIGIMWGIGYFAHRRLIFHPNPPEKEKD
jgi:DNA-directed RNA polymerase subunit RPC12/RpoP